MSAPDRANAAEPASAEPPSVVVYDGACSFCQRSIEHIRRRAPAGAFRYVPFQDPALLEELPQLRGADMEEGLRFVTPDGTVHTAADAVFQIASRLPFYRRLSWLYRVPGLRGVARAAYAWVARRRMGLGRSCAPDDACRLDGP